MTFNDVPKDSTFYTTTSRFVPYLGTLSEYNCKKSCTSSQSQNHVGSNDGLSSQDGVSQQWEDTPLTIPQLNRFPVSLRAEQLHFGVHQRVVATVEDSVLRTEMTSLESQEEDDPRHVLWF